MIAIPILWIIIGSVLFFVVGLVGAVATVVWLPADFFIRDAKKYFWDHHPLLRIIVLILRNVLGIAVLVAGVIMLVTPGQGLLTILIGLLLVTFPGKRQLVHRIVTRPAIVQALNGLRARFNRPPFVMEVSGD